MDLIGGNKNCCIFATKPIITYAASNPASYLILSVRNMSGQQLMEDRVIDFDELKAVFDFKIAIDSDESRANRIKVQFTMKWQKMRSPALLYKNCFLQEGLW